MVSTDENGRGSLFVDGEAQELVSAFDEYDLNLGYADIGTKLFRTEVYPNNKLQTGAGFRK